MVDSSDDHTRASWLTCAKLAPNRRQGAGGTMRRELSQLGRDELVRKYPRRRGHGDASLVDPSVKSRPSGSLTVVHSPNSVEWAAAVCASVSLGRPGTFRVEYHERSCFEQARWRGPQGHLVLCTTVRVACPTFNADSEAARLHLWNNPGGGDISLARGPRSCEFEFEFLPSLG